jgi:hypothetical protein
MRNYGIDDWNGFVAEYDKHITHVVVAHTKQRPFVNAQDKRITDVEGRVAWQATQAIKDCRYALNCFNKLLHYGNGSRVVRNAEQYRALSFVTLEGAKVTTDSRQTLHFNISLGNLPKHFTTQDIDTLFKYAWCDMAGQSRDVLVQDYYRQEGKNWHSYVGKEANYDRQRVWGENSIVVVENCWIPHKALATD